jgi:hypothetical protein
MLYMAPILRQNDKHALHAEEGKNMNLKRYMFELGAAILLYAAVLVLSLLALRGGGVDHPGARIAISLMPMLPGGAICWVLLRQMRRLDELGVRVWFEALGLAFAATALLTFSYGFLENVGFPRLSMFAVWPLMSACWGLGLAIANWRYR